MATKSIAVFGGNGFLGRKICEVGVRLGYNVTSYSRSGKAPAELQQQPWAAKVQWDTADIFNSSSYAAKLRQHHTVVHSIGMLFENQSYKKVINSNFKVLDDVQNLANMLKGSNPMEKENHSTFESVQRDSAVMLADALIDAHKDSPAKPTFVYISADQKPPLVSEKYLITKREAEFELAAKPGVRSIFMRPAFMYDDGQVNSRTVLKNLISLGCTAKNSTVGDNVSYINNLIKPSASTEQVALKLYERLEEPGFHGVVDSKSIVNI